MTAMRRRTPAVASGESIRFRVRLTPKARGDEITGVADGALVVRVTAAPIENAANRALMRLLARELDVPRSAIHLVAGEKDRLKVVEVFDVTPAAVAARWPGLLEKP